VSGARLTLKVGQRWDEGGTSLVIPVSVPPRLTFSKKKKIYNPRGVQGGGEGEVVCVRE
jgi:hypothetical protein